MSIRSKFLLFVALPVAVVTVAGVSSSSFTFGQNVSTIQADVEQVNYIVPMTTEIGNANSWDATSTVMGRAGTTVAVKTKYGELPQWTQISNGVQGYPSTINQPGDLLFVNARSSTSCSADTNRGLKLNSSCAAGNNTNVVSDLFIKGNITNVADLRTVYRSCLIPIRLWNSTNTGDTWTDITDTALGVDGGQPYYIDCETGQFEFTVPTAATAYNVSGNLDYVVTVEAGGNFATMNENSANNGGTLEGITPEFLFTATPIAEAFTAIN
ncbi:MAG: hypothetical protein RLZ28_435 [Actinomycetota bacterium]|jgi:hypothetical protein